MHSAQISPMALQEDNLTLETFSSFASHSRRMESKGDHSISNSFALSTFKRNKSIQSLFNSDPIALTEQERIADDLSSNAAIKC